MLRLRAKIKDFCFVTSICSFTVEGVNLNAKKFNFCYQFQLILAQGLIWVPSKGQENPNFSAFDTLGSETDNPAFDPGRFGTRPDGTEILKLYAKPEVEIVRKLERCTQNHIDARYDEVNEHS